MHATYNTTEKTNQNAPEKSPGSEPHLVIEYLAECCMIAQHIGIAKEHKTGIHKAKVGLVASDSARGSLVMNRLERLTNTPQISKSIIPNTAEGLMLCL